MFVPVQEIDFSASVLPPLQISIGSLKHCAYNYLSLQCCGKVQCIVQYILGHFPARD